MYEEGVYVFGEHKIESLLESWLGAKTTTHEVNEVLNHIQRSSYTERTEFNKFAGILPVLNGLLDLKTLTLKPFDKNQVFPFKINAVFDSSKDCPKFKKWLGEVQTEENSPALQEYAGYCVLPAMSFHRSS